MNNTIYDVILDTAKSLHASVIQKNLTETEIREKETLIRKLVRDYAQENGIRAEETKRPAYRRQKGSRPAACTDNACDMLRGCLNRMAVSDSDEEKERMFHSALYHISVLADTALEAVGALTVEEYEWKSPSLSGVPRR